MAVTLSLPFLDNKWISHCSTKGGFWVLGAAFVFVAGAIEFLPVSAHITPPLFLQVVPSNPF